MSRPIFVRKTKTYGEILPHPQVANQLICIWRNKVSRWFSETILLPAYIVTPAIGADVAEALYMAANFAAEITDKRRLGKNAGVPGIPVEGGLQVFKHDSRFVIQIADVAPEDGGGKRILIPAHRSLDIPSAAQFANVIYQACGAARG
jgi:hypothetical protein